MAAPLPVMNFGKWKKGTGFRNRTLARKGFQRLVHCLSTSFNNSLILCFSARNFAHLFTHKDIHL